MVLNDSSEMTQRRSNSRTSLQQNRGEAPWLRDHRRTPRSVRSTPPQYRKRPNASNNPFDSPSASRSTPSPTSLLPFPGHSSQAFRQETMNSGNNNPFDTPPPVSRPNPFDTPSPKIRNGNNPFESPTPTKMIDSSRTNPFDVPTPSPPGRRPPVPQQQRHRNITPLSPTTKDSVALDSLEQILDTTDETDPMEETEEEVEALTDGGQHAQYYHPRQHTSVQLKNNNNEFSFNQPSPFRTPTPSESTPLSSYRTPSSREAYIPSKKNLLTPATTTTTPTSAKSLHSWGDSTSSKSGGGNASLETTPSEKALRAAETLRKSFEQRRRNRSLAARKLQQQSPSTVQTQTPRSSYESSRQYSQEGDGDSTLYGLALEYSKTDESGSSTKNKDNNNNRGRYGEERGIDEEKKQDDGSELVENREGHNRQSDENDIENDIENDGKKEKTEESADNYILHDLCDEARSTDDIAWRNGLYILSVRPELASIKEPECNMTPLHVAFLAHEPPPIWMTRALLYTAPTSCSQTDNGGRLPLHLLVATSADLDTIRLLVEEYPPGVAHRDDRGFTPLQLLLKNDQITLTLEHLRLLLGQISFFSGNKEPSKANRDHKHMLFRRGDHLRISIEELEVLGQEREENHESMFREYPDDVRQALTKLSQWRRRQVNKELRKKSKQEKDELDFLISKELDFMNPATIATPTGRLLPLHLLVRRKIQSFQSDNVFSIKNASLADLLRVLIAAYPQGLIGSDANGKTPIMTAMLQTDALPNEEVVELLLGLRTPGFGSQNRERPALIPTGDTHQLPLHVAAEELVSDISLLTTICEAYPDARKVQDIRGRTPLHLAFQNYRSIPVDEATLELLFVNPVAKIKDNDGKTPFDILLKNPKCMRAPAGHNSIVIQDFLNSSIEKPQTGRECQNLLSDLRELPPWLRRQACASRSVQDTLLEEISTPFNTFRILCSGFVIVILLVLLRRLLHVNDNLAVLIYYLATYHLVMQMMYWCTTLYMGEFLRLCLLNVFRWIDIITGILAIWCAYAVGDTSQDDGTTYNTNLSTLGAAATAACWLSLLGYLVDWWCGVAVFVGSAIQLLYVLIWPLCVAAMGIIATSQILYTLEDCTGGGNVCSISDAYTMVYWMILGEPVLSEDYQFSKSMMATIIVFTILWIWWIFSTIATTIAEANQLNRQQLALTWYWETKVVVSVMATHRGQNGKISNTRSLMEQYCDFMEGWWDILSSALLGNDSATYWNVWCLRSKYGIWMTAIMAIFLIPIWLILGLFTFGILWPPQIRQWLFRLHPETSAYSNNNHNRPKRYDDYEDDLTRRKVLQLRGDIIELKSIAYDQNYQIQKDLGFVKDIILRAVLDEDEKNDYNDNVDFGEHPKQQ